MKAIDTLLEKYRRAAANRGYTCDVCGKEVFSYPARRLCGECFSALAGNDDKTCPKCGRKTITEGVCLACKRSPPAFSLGISPFVYEGEAGVLLNRFKNGDRYLGFFFAQEMTEAFRRKALRGVEGAEKELLVVPVPMTKEKIRKRGYNQAEELAKTITYELKAIFCADVFEKIRETKPQKLLTAQEREKNVAGAYRLVKREACREQRVLLVDDLMTTGATGSECARLLFKAGAKEVFFLTAASAAEKK